MMALGDETWLKLVAQETVPVPANIAQALRLPPGSKGARIVGVRHAEAGPFQHVTGWVPTPIALALSDEGLSKTSPTAPTERQADSRIHKLEPAAGTVPAPRQV